MLTYSQPTDLAKLSPVKFAADLRAAVEFGLAGPLAKFDDITASASSGEGKWSAKQVVGHLIDSVNNNLQRVVRLSIDESLAMPGYKQAEWVAVQHYNKRHWSDLVILWSALNLHLAHIMAHVEKTHLSREWTFDEGTVSLGFIMQDYIAHMLHHLERMPVF